MEGKDLHNTIACQCGRCGKTFDFKERVIAGNGLRMFSSPCCKGSFTVIDDTTTRFLDKLYPDINNDPRYYKYTRK